MCMLVYTVKLCLSNDSISNFWLYRITMPCHKRCKHIEVCLCFIKHTDIEVQLIINVVFSPYQTAEQQVYQSYRATLVRCSWLSVYAKMLLTFFTQLHHLLIYLAFHFQKISKIFHFGFIVLRNATDFVFQLKIKYML